MNGVLVHGLSGFFAACLLAGVVGLSGAAETASVEAHYAKLRERMVKQHMEYRDVRDKNVLRVMEKVPRHVFVPDREKEHAYEDRPLPIGWGQTISQPYMVAAMTELLNLQKNDRVLEVGTGSGYQAAVLAELVERVYTIEILEPLGQQAAKALATLGYTNIITCIGDGYRGWPEHAPFDAIMVTAAPDHIPPPLVEQLKPGGRMVIPVGGRDDVQSLLLVEKGKDGTVRKKNKMAVRFVPLTGDH